MWPTCTPRMKKIAAIVDAGENAEIVGIRARMQMIRKNMLAAFWYCSKRFCDTGNQALHITELKQTMGRNTSQLGYLFVRKTLSTYRDFPFFGSRLSEGFATYIFCSKHIVRKVVSPHGRTRSYETGEDDV